MRHVAGDMHPPTSVHEMRAAPGTKSRTKGRTAGCPALKLDDRLRLPCCSSRQHTGIRKRCQGTKCTTTIDTLNSLEPTAVKKASVHNIARWHKHEKLISRKCTLLESLEPRPRAPLRDDQHEVAASHQQLVHHARYERDRRRNPVPHRLPLNWLPRAQQAGELLHASDAKREQPVDTRRCKR